MLGKKDLPRGYITILCSCESFLYARRENPFCYSDDEYAVVCEIAQKERCDGYQEAREGCVRTRVSLRRREIDRARERINSRSIKRVISRDTSRKENSVFTYERACDDDDDLTERSRM